MASPPGLLATASAAVTMGDGSARQRLRKEVRSWQGVEVRPHRFGGEAFYLGRREIGHIHGDHLLDVPLTKALRDDWVKAGKARVHHHFPDSGWVSLRLAGEDDLSRALELLRVAYQLRRKRGQRS